MSIHKNKKKLIITLHDFGKTKTINEGIVFAMNQPENIATEYSLMPNGLASAEGAQIAKERSDLSFDLCITFTDFSPVGKSYKTLTDGSGNFLKADTQNWDFSILDIYDEKEVAQEIEVQYDWFLKNVGRKPSALTTQKSEHGDPKILVPLVDLAVKEKLPIRTPAWQWFSNYAAQSYVEDIGIKFTKKVFVATKDWKGKNGYALDEDSEKLISLIEKNEEVTEIVILAGFVDKELLKMSSVSWQRGEYLNLLLRKPEVLKTYKEKFDLISYTDL